MRSNQLIRNTGKCTFGHLRLAKTQISLRTARRYIDMQGFFSWTAIIVDPQVEP